MIKSFFIVPAIAVLLASPVSGVLAAGPTQEELEARRREYLQEHKDHITAVHASIRERYAHHKAWTAQKKDELRARHRRLMAWRKWNAEN